MYGAGPMSLVAQIERIRTDPELGRNFATWHHLPASPPDPVPYPASLDRRLAEALRGRGIDALYRHQAEAVEAALSGEHTVIVTPTASGKTLCYNLAVLQTLLAEPE